MSRNDAYPTIKLMELCSPKQWPTIPKSKLTDAGYPVFGANGCIGFYTEYTHAEPTVLITCRGATCGTINVCEPRSYVTGNSMALDSLDASRVDMNFLCYALRQRGLDDAISGTAQPQITRTSLQGVTIPLPPLAEQRRIAAILDKADAVRRKRQKAIELTEQFLKSAFLDMFGDPVGDGLCTIGELLDSRRLLVHKDGNFGSQYPRAHEFGDSGIPFLTAKSFTDKGALVHSEVSYLNETKARTFTYGWLEQEDVLLAHNATVGRVAVYGGDFEQALIGTSLTCFRPDQGAIDPYFLSGCLRSEFFQSQLAKSMEQTTRNQVPITAQRRMSVFLPPLEAQKKFRTLALSHSQLCERIAGAAVTERNLFNSLVQRAFRGELTSAEVTA